jgi:hypothetical protein
MVTLAVQMLGIPHLISPLIYVFSFQKPVILFEF